MTLFDFEIDNEVKESDILAGFELFKQEFKQLGNYHSASLSALSPGLRPYLIHFQDKGWIKISRGRIEPNRDLLDYHTPEEAVEMYQESIDLLLKQTNVNWYNSLLPASHFTVTFKNNEDKERFYKLKAVVTKETAMKLGLKHFLEIPSARGSKMNRFDSKWERKHVLPMIAEWIIPMTDYDEIDRFFRTHAFFCGRRDWAWNDSNATPYAEYKTVMPGSLHLAALAEAQDVKTVGLILSYTGGSWSKREATTRKILYPDGWSHEKYTETLTADDLDRIYQDLERLDRLHGGRYLNGHSA